MEMEHIKYNVDSGISIFCTKSRETEVKVISLDHVRHAIINYDISLINNAVSRVRERYKVNKGSIEFQEDNFVLFFPLENIIRPNESQITLRSIVFYLKESRNLEFQIDQTYSFNELQRNNGGKIVHFLELNFQ